MFVLETELVMLTKQSLKLFIYKERLKKNSSINYLVIVLTHKLPTKGLLRSPLKVSPVSEQEKQDEY